MNENILYVDYLESYKEVIKVKFPNILKKIIYKIFNFFGVAKIDNNYLVLMSTCEDINDKMLAKVCKTAQQLKLKNIALADKLKNNSLIQEKLLKCDFIFLDGTKIYKFLTYEIVNKIAYIQNLRMQSMEITFLTNNNSDVNLENIKLLAQRCKIINILTEKVELFSSLEKQLYEENGIIINVSSNKRKTCMYSDIILNVDFDNKILEKCKLREKTIIVQFTKSKFENKTGVTITSYKLNIPEKYCKNKELVKHFSNEIIYESYFYYKLSFKNVRKILKKDNISVKHFIGNNGKISFKEIKENHFKKSAKILDKIK